MNNLNYRDEMLKDLQFIKEAVKKNNNILRYISISSAVKFVALFTAIIIIGFSLIYLWIIDYYGGYNNTPNQLKLLAYFFIGTSLIVLSWYKIKSFLTLEDCTERI